MMKRFGVLTSGADAPGMNAAIRAVVRSGIYYGVDMLGIQYGFQGLIDGKIEKMDAASVGSIMQRGGTILQSSPSDVVFSEEGKAKALQMIKQHGIDSLIVIGGKESLQAAAVLEEAGLPTAAIPATIDSDIPGVYEVIGFDTALNTVMDYIDRIRDTASSHEKSSIIEVMGRDTGSLALWSGLAGGAENILIPEKKEDLDSIVEQIKQGPSRSKRYSIVVVAEGTVSGIDLNERLKQEAGIESRVTVLGHTQRGGAPTAADRILASRLGAYAVDLLIKDQSGVIVTIKDNQPEALTYGSVHAKTVQVDEDVYNLSSRLSI